MDDQSANREGGPRLKVPTAAGAAAFVRVVRIVAVGLTIPGAYLVLTNHPKGVVVLVLGFVEIALGEFIAWRVRKIMRKHPPEKN